MPRSRTEARVLMYVQGSSQGSSASSSCYRPVIDEDRLQEHACTLFTKVCIDQVRIMISHRIYSALLLISIKMHKFTTFQLSCTIKAQHLQDLDCTLAIDLHCACTDHVLSVQGRFVMFSDEMRPGRTFWRDDVFDITQTADGPFYNVPGYLDNFKVSYMHLCICTHTGLYVAL